MRHPQDCIPRQDYTALMNIFNTTRKANADLAGELRQHQTENESLHGLLADASSVLYKIEACATVPDDGGLEIIGSAASACLQRIKEANATPSALHCLTCGDPDCEGR